MVSIRGKLPIHLDRLKPSSKSLRNCQVATADMVASELPF
jgi:hypothetical protein